MTEKTNQSLKILKTDSTKITHDQKYANNKKSKILVLSSSNLVKVIKPRGSGACSKLGAQITYESLKSGCAKSETYLIESQKVGAQMRTLAH